MHIVVPVLSYSIISAYAKTALRMMTGPALNSADSVVGDSALLLRNKHTLFNMHIFPYHLV